MLQSTRCSKGAAQGPRADDFVRLWVGEKRGLEGLPRRRLFSSKNRALMSRAQIWPATRKSVWSSGSTRDVRIGSCGRGSDDFQTTRSMSGAPIASTKRKPMILLKARAVRHQPSSTRLVGELRRGTFGSWFEERSVPAIRLAGASSWRARRHIDRARTGVALS